MKEYEIGDTLNLGNCTNCGNVIVIEPDNGLFRPQRCGNPVKLADGSWLCGSCLRKLNEKEAKQELEHAHDYLEDLREKYGFHQAVFSVEKVDVKKGGFLKPSFYTVTGHVLYGTFTPLDEVSIGMNGAQKAKISCLDNPHSTVPVSDATVQRGTNKLLIDYSWAEGGEEAAFIFQEKNLNLKPGDLIIKD